MDIFSYDFVTQVNSQKVYFASIIYPLPRHWKIDIFANPFRFDRCLLMTLKHAQTDKAPNHETYRHLFQRNLTCAKRNRSRNSLHHKNQSLEDTLRSQSVVKNSPVSTTDRILNVFKYETS